MIDCTMWIGLNVGGVPSLHEAQVIAATQDAFGTESLTIQRATGVWMNEVENSLIVSIFGLALEPSAAKRRVAELAAILKQESIAVRIRASEVEFIPALTR